MFLDAHARTTGVIDRVLADEVGMRLGDYRVLSHLMEADGELRMNRLAEQCLLSPSGLTRRFDALARRGWVARSACVKDGRGVMAVLTEEGRRVFEAARPTHSAMVQQLFVAPLTPHQLATLTRALEVIAANEHHGGQTPSS